jgi:signal peptidase I
MRSIFEADSANQIWLNKPSQYRDSNILVTVSTAQGEKTAYITEDSITQSYARYYVEAPPERIASSSALRFSKMKQTVKWIGYLSTVTLLSFSVLSFSGVVKARIVLTGSMAPNINAGDVIITTIPKYHFPVKGDVLTYTAKRFNGAPVAVISHRIIGGDATTGFIVKGDQNKSPDVQKPKLGDVLGVVVFVIPFIGNLLSPKALFLIIPSLIGFWLILDALKNED